MNFRDFGKYNQFKEQFAGMSPEMKEQMMKMAKEQMKAKIREFVQKWLSTPILTAVALVLGAVVGIIYTKRHGIDSWAMADIVAPAVILGQALGRCANLLNGDAFGAPTGGDFGILYPSTTLAYRTYGSQPLWPAEIWEGQLDMAIFALLLMYRTTSHAKGQAFSLYVILYSVARFFLEYFRGDYAEPVLGLFTSAQTTSLVAVVLGAAAWIWFGAREKKTAKTPDAPQ